MLKLMLYKEFTERSLLSCVFGGSNNFNNSNDGEIPAFYFNNH